MYDRITLDRETFKALAMDTRIRILRMLEKHYQYTLTDLANEMEMAPSTIKEHLDKLLEVGLITQIERGKKWKYYRLTDKGKKILNPYEKRVMIILAATLLFLFGVVYRLIYMMSGLLKPAVLQETTPSLVARKTTDYAEKAVSAGIEAIETTTTTIPTEIPVAQIPYAELILALVLALVAGICIGYLIRKRIV